MSDPIRDSLQSAKHAAIMEHQQIHNELEMLYGRINALLERASYLQSLASDLDAKLEFHQPSVEQSNLLSFEEHPRTQNALGSPQSDSLSVREMLVHILRGSPRGLDVRTLLNLLKSVFGADVPRTTVSPQLSRMKQEGLLTLEGDVWKLSNGYRNHLNRLAHLGA